MSFYLPEHLILLDGVDEQVNRNGYQLKQLLNEIFYEISKSRNVCV